LRVVVNRVCLAVMTQERDIDLINDLLKLPVEAPSVEFKHNNSDPSDIGKYCSALSNSARLEGKHVAYLVWGIEDATHRVVGTTFNPFTKKIGNQDFQLWLAHKLMPSPSFEFREVLHPNGRLILLEIAATITAPTMFDGTAHIRIGSTTPKLSEFPERYSALVEALRPYAWETGHARSYISADEVLDLLDYSSYFRLVQQPLPDNRAGIFEKLVADQLISEDFGGRWNITNLGAILFAADLSKFSTAIARKGVRFVSYKGADRSAVVDQRRDGKLGYANGFLGLVRFIDGLLPKNEHIGEALRLERPLFPELAIRELVANALIHQDMTITGAGPLIEMFVDRIEISNPGASLVALDRMIDLPPRSRNEALASLMRRMRLCEEQGSGLDKAVRQAEIFQLPPILFRQAEQSIQVILYGPRSFAKMTAEERIRACYHHSILKFLSGDRMKNSSLCERFGISKPNAAQATNVINSALKRVLIKPADAEHPRAGYLPFWA
jgi:ATP-dependent DNA helicase RecG